MVMTRLSYKKQYLNRTCLLILVIVTIINPFVCSLDANAQSSDANANLPLIQPNNLTYIGGFRLPSGSVGTRDPYDKFDYSGGAMAFNPADHGLFVACHDYANGAIAEVSIPSNPSRSPNVLDLPIATV